MTTSTTIPHGNIGELVRYCLRLGFLGFGGPVALVGQMERELVVERQWLLIAYPLLQPTWVMVQ
jgi:chromate transporter